MTIPAYLKPSDKIAIVATARKIVPEELEAAIKVFKDAGYQVELSNNLFNEQNQFAGSDDERAEDLQWALDDDSVKAVISARGGYGTMRIIDKLNFDRFTENPKWICGYSDITVLHSHIHSLYKISTLHSTMPINFGKNEEAVNTLLDALSGKLNGYSFASNPFNKNGTAEGVLVGGNLSLLYALSASASDLNTKGKILFLEDLDEYLYHIDRMMMQLKRSGKLKNLAGLVIGGMTDMKDNAIPFGKTAEEIILDAVKEYDFPVAFNYPAGHIDRNLATYLGRECSLKMSDRGSELQFV